ncbi:MAG TPA: hypothetical protein VHZ24_05425 [Pirellulales bacterium]|jgi:hypothetical protein|nr:hypothetical protein [Pirellulales bacterium]
MTVSIHVDIETTTPGDGPCGCYASAEIKHSPDIHVSETADDARKAIDRAGNVMLHALTQALDH